MGIITKEVEVIPSGKNIKYYKDLGYNVKWHEPLIVYVDDLPCSSHTQIEVLCDMCNKNKMFVAYDVYNRVVKNTGNYVCRQCSYEKTAQTNRKKYGVETPLKIDKVKEKIRHTNLERYGVENYAQTEECHEKIKQTCLDKYNVEHYSQLQEIKDKKAKTNLKRYGAEYISQIEEFRKKILNTSLERYGVDHPSKTFEVQEKIRQSNMKKYGVPYVMQSYDILEKAKTTLCKNGAIIQTSKQQLFLHSLYGGKLNYPIKYYATDICFSEEKLVIEYDGGGHDLRVTLGRLTQEEFDRKEIIRNNIIKREGYKQMRIISTKDLLPSDSILLQMLDYARNYFSQYPEHSWIEFNLDTSSIRNAECKDSIPYNYGELRTIKDSDLNIVKEII